MRLRVNINKNGSKNYYVIESFRDDNGRNTSRVIERLGTYDELAKIHSNPDEWAKEYVRELNEKSADVPVDVKYSQNTLIEKDRQNHFEGGYLFLQKIYHEIRLDYIFKKITKKYDFEYDFNGVFSKLIYGLILQPDSKDNRFKYLSKLIEPVKFEQYNISRAFDIISDEMMYIQSALYKLNNDLTSRNDKVVYYEFTNCYIGIEQERDICEYGYSEECRPNLIEQMGLFMDGDGIPLAFDISNSLNESKTLNPLEKEIIETSNKSRFVVCTDYDLSSIEKTKINNNLDCHFIFVHSLEMMKDNIKEWALDFKSWRLFGDDDNDSGHITVYNLETIINDKNLARLYYNKIFYKEKRYIENDLEERYIVVFTLKHQSFPSNRRMYRIDVDALENEQEYDGFYCVTTDIEDPAEEVVKIIKGRREIEECFGVIKSNLEVRSLYLRNEKRIKAHFTTCFLSLSIIRHIEKRLNYKYSYHQIIDGLNDIKFLPVPNYGYIPTYTRNQFTDDLHEAFGFRTDYEILSKSAMRKIFSETKKK